MEARLWTAPQLCTSSASSNTAAKIAVFIPAAVVSMDTVIPNAQLAHMVHSLLDRQNLLATFPGAGNWTQALVSANAIDASAAICTGGRGTLVHVDATVGTSKPHRAFAPEPIDAVYALAAIVTWIRVAVIDIRLAGRSSEALLTHATERVPTVDTGGTVMARVGTASRILGYMTRAPLPSFGATADIGSALVHARAPIVAGIRVAMAVPQRTRLALPAFLAFTSKIGNLVHASPAITARIGITFIFVDAAQGSFPTIPTDALERIDTVHARCSILALVVSTVVDILVAIFPFVPRVTQTLKTTIFLVDAAPMIATHIRWRLLVVC